MSGMKLSMIDMGKADLHIHTYYSDGQSSPGAIVEKAGKMGYSDIAITDHDGIGGVKEAVDAGRKNGVRVIPGIELDTETEQGVDLHILGYGMDLEDRDFRRVMKELDRRRQRRNEGLLKALTDMGYPLSLSELKERHPGGYVGKPVIARAMVEKGYIADYREAFSPGRFLESSRARAVKKEPFSSSEAISLIRGAGGIPVLAHPIQIKGMGITGSEDFYRDVEKLVVSLADQGLGGLECYHPDQDEKQAGRFAGMAHRHGLWITRGSDFHGSDYSQEQDWIRKNPFLSVTD